MPTRHPTLQESVEFLNEPEAPGESVCEMKVSLGPREGLRAHVHPRQTEHFEVLEGELLLLRDGDARRLTSGESWRVPPGVDHRWENLTDGTTVFRATFDPALRTRRLFLSLNGIPEEAFHGGGTPGLPYAVMLGRRYPGHIELPGIPGVLQRVLFFLLAPIVLALGYRVPPRGNPPGSQTPLTSTDRVPRDEHA